MKTIHRMRVIFAGLFVFIGMVVGIDLISYWWGDKEPAWPWVIFVGIYNPLLILAAYVLFNLGVPRPWSPKPEDDARKLDEQGLLTEETLYATRALQVIDDYDDEGPELPSRIDRRWSTVLERLLFIPNLNAQETHGDISVH